MHTLKAIIRKPAHGFRITAKVKHWWYVTLLQHVVAQQGFKIQFLNKPDNHATR